MHQRASSANTFESIAREWLGKQPFAPKTMKRAVWTFDDLLFHYIGSRPVSALTAPELLGVVRRLERRGSMRRHTEGQAARGTGGSLRDRDRACRARPHGGSSRGLGSRDAPVTNRAAIIGSARSRAAAPVRGIAARCR